MTLVLFLFCWYGQTISRRSSMLVTEQHSSFAIQQTDQQGVPNMSHKDHGVTHHCTNLRCSANTTVRVPCTCSIDMHRQHDKYGRTPLQAWYRSRLDWENTTTYSIFRYICHLILDVLLWNLICCEECTLQLLKWVTRWQVSIMTSLLLFIVNFPLTGEQVIVTFILLIN